MNEIIMYGADWCPDCRRAKSFLAEHGIEYEYHDTELDESAVEIVERLNNGKRVIPTFEILGQTHTNPDNNTFIRSVWLCHMRLIFLHEFIIRINGIHHSQVTTEFRYQDGLMFVRGSPAAAGWEDRATLEIAFSN